MPGITKTLKRFFGSLITPGQARLASALGRQLDAKIGPPWKQNAEGDLYPDSPGQESSIGTPNQPLTYLVMGRPQENGIDGGLLHREVVDGGGVSLVGLRDYDPTGPVVRPLEGNAYVEISGAAVLVTTGTLWLELSAPIEEDHEVLLGPSITLPDGRYVSPLLEGPEKVYQYEESASDNTDIDLLNRGAVELLSLTLTNNYSADVTNFSFQVLVDNPGNKASRFVVSIKLDGVVQYTQEVTITSSSITISDSDTVDQSVTAGQVISMEIELFTTHPQSRGWVLGSSQPTTMKIKQG